MGKLDKLKAKKAKEDSIKASEIARVKEYLDRGLTAAGWTMLTSRMHFERFVGESRDPAYYMITGDGCGSFELSVVTRIDPTMCTRVFKDADMLGRGVWIRQAGSGTLIHQGVAAAMIGTNEWYDHWSLLEDLWSSWTRWSETL